MVTVTRLDQFGIPALREALGACSLTDEELRAAYERGRAAGPGPWSNVEDEQDRASRLAAQAAGRRAAWSRRLPVVYADADLDQLDEEQDPGGRIRRWLDRPDSRVLVLTGEPGKGKTHAAYAVGADALARGRWVVAWTTADLLAACRPPADCRAFDEAVDCELLILDDLGREQVSDWTLELVQRVLDGRGREGRRTVITTNLSGEQVRDRYGQPVLSRLSDTVTAVRVEGRHRRQPAAW